MFSLLLTIIYLSFISLGLPDALLGSAWPAMFRELQVSVSSAGLISMIIAFGTIASSLMSERVTCRLGAGLVTGISVGITALALLGFSVSTRFWMLCLWAVPYGLGAGSVDACLNNYVALHYASRHMSWLHCMWGLGAATGPYVMGYVLAGGGSWHMGYRVIGILQIILTAALFFTLPLWKKPRHSGTERTEPMTMGRILRLPGAGEVLVAFFCYCALEQTAGLWGSSYLALFRGVPAQQAASFGSLFFIGITVGRGLNGFLTLRWTDRQLIRLGEGIIALGIAAMLLPLGRGASLAGLVLVGLGCAPIYPCVIHSTPTHFGEDKSQAMIGVQMASAYTGILLMPPLYGVLAKSVSMALLPLYLLGILILMAWMYERLLKKTEKAGKMTQ